MDSTQKKTDRYRFLQIIPSDTSNLYMYSNDLFQYYSIIVLNTTAANSSTDKSIVVPISFSKILYVGISQNDTVDTCTGGGRLNIHYIWYSSGNNINVKIINNGNYDGWNQFYVSIIGIL